MRTQPCPAGPRRISLRVDDVELDVSLPDGVPIAELLPALSDLAIERGADMWSVPLARQLSLLGGAPVETSMTLSEAGIPDGAILVLGTTPPDPPVLRWPIEASPAATGTKPLAAPSTRCGALLATAGFAGLSGYLVVPGDGSPRLLLGAATACATTVAGVRWLPDGWPVLVPAAILAGLAAVAAAAGTAAHLPLPDTGIILTGLAIAALVLAGRVAVRVGAHWVNSVTAGSGCAVALGSALAAAGPVEWSRTALAAIAIAVLIGRSSTVTEPTARFVLVVSGLVGTATLLLGLGGAAPAAFGAVVTCWLGFDPVRAEWLARLAGKAEKFMLIGVPPMALWALGLIGSHRW